jgi:hypothetical protein
MKKQQCNKYGKVKMKASEVQEMPDKSKSRRKFKGGNGVNIFNNFHPNAVNDQFNINNNYNNDNNYITSKCRKGVVPLLSLVNEAEEIPLINNTINSQHSGVVKGSTHTPSKSSYPFFFDENVLYNQEYSINQLTSRTEPFVFNESLFFSEFMDKTLEEDKKPVKPIQKLLPTVNGLENTILFSKNETPPQVSKLKKITGIGKVVVGKGRRKSSTGENQSDNSFRGNTYDDDDGADEEEGDNDGDDDVEELNEHGMMFKKKNKVVVKKSVIEKDIKSLLERRPDLSKFIEVNDDNGLLSKKLPLERSELLGKKELIGVSDIKIKTDLKLSEI